MKTLIIYLLPFVSAVHLQGIGQEIHSKPGGKAYGKTDLLIPDRRVSKSLVCMVDDKYFGETQIAVHIDGKTYFGCCEPCIEFLQSSKEIRYATDPLTGKKVDKGAAYIVTKSGGNGQILYFGSKRNYRKYLNAQRN